MNEFRANVLAALNAELTADQLRALVYGPTGFAAQAAVFAGDEFLTAQQLLALVTGRLEALEKQRAAQLAELEGAEKRRQAQLAELDEFKNRALTNWKRARSVMEHENLLVNHRMTWFLMSQAALFTAFALLMQAYGGATAEVTKATAQAAKATDEIAKTTAEATRTAAESARVLYFSFALSFVLLGIAVCYILYVMLDAAGCHHDAVRQWWEQPDVCGNLADHPGIAGRAFGNSWHDWLTRISRLPVVALCVWLVLGGLGVAHSAYNDASILWYALGIPLAVLLLLVLLRQVWNWVFAWLAPVTPPPTLPPAAPVPVERRDPE